MHAMKGSVARAKAKQRARGEPEEAVLSVFTDAVLDAEAIARRAPILTRWSKIRTTTLGELRAQGFEVTHPDEIGHASVKLPDPPSDDDYVRFLGAFGAPEPNPIL
jgi:hypothetical protein